MSEEPIESQTPASASTTSYAPTARSDPESSSAPSGYEWYVPRLPRVAKWLIWIAIVLLGAAVLWFWVFPFALGFLPDNF